jgi:alkanesulfonate monooxygenase SsuD/methylene tetrahydromethanopterin reductase-like flavin-dependent oxidoreductase (luciferase family)
VAGLDSREIHFTGDEVMKFGLFCSPFNTAYKDGRRTNRQVIDWDLQLARWGDQYGQSEIWFAEHHTVGMEPSPAPELLIAAASQLTSRIKLCAGAHLLAYHNPIALAHRMIMLDHMTGGRYIAGIAPGAFPTDGHYFCTGKNNNEMMLEAIEIVKAVLTNHEPWEIKGKYWSASRPPFDATIGGPHLKPLTKPHPPFAMTGMQPISPTLTLAGKNGFLPVSQQVNTDTLLKHWEVYSKSAEAAGHVADRSGWRIIRDFFVADTDEEARDLFINGPASDAWAKFLIPSYRRLNLLGLIGGDQMNPDDVTMEWMAENFWLVGSPKTVAEKVRALDEELGGVGTILAFTYDYSETPDVYQKSLRLLHEKVMPLLG